MTTKTKTRKPATNIATGTFLLMLVALLTNAENAIIMESPNTYCVETLGGTTIREFEGGQMQYLCALENGDIVDVLKIVTENYAKLTNKTVNTTTTTTTQPIDDGIISVPPIQTTILPHLPTEKPTTTTSAPTEEKPIQICGNGIVEPGEECDTTPDGCSEGNFECKNCRCIEIQTPADQPDIPQSEHIETSPIEGLNPTYIIATLLVIVCGIVALVWAMGSDVEPNPKN